ncbi:MAG: DnaB-like helicase C-terminal domain-containing protein [Candidatus Kariarchaeaceae archaeon]
MKVYCAFGDKDKSLPPRTFTEKDEARFKEMNEKGYGIFVSVNDFLPVKTGMKTPRHNDNIQNLNAVFCDMDTSKGDLPDDQVAKAKEILVNAMKEKCEPTIIVDTRNGLQPYWKIEPSTDIDLYRKVIEGIIEWSKEYGNIGDPVKDPARVLRMPGYYHHKAEPYLCQAFGGGGGVYTLEELIKIFPAPELKPEYVQTQDQFFSHQKTMVDAIDIKDIVVKVRGCIGESITFDRSGRVQGNGTTGSFQGRNGDRQYMASHSHNPIKGNKVTIVAETLGVTTQKAWAWILENFNIPTERELKKKYNKEHGIEEESAYSLVSWTDLLNQGVEETKVADPSQVMDYGYSFLNDQLGGLFEGELLLVGGITGTGKTTLALKIAEKQALKGKKVVVIALEERNITRARKATAYEINRQRARFKKPLLNMKDFLIGKDKPDEAEQLSAIEKIKNDNLKYLTTKKQLTIDQLDEIYEKEKADLYVVDHLHYFGLKEDRSKADAIEKSMQHIKNLTVQNNARTILIAHFQKVDESKKPTMTNFKDGISIAQTADTILMLWRDKAEGEKETQYKTEFICPKNRIDQPAFTAHAVFDISTNEYQKTINLSYGTENSDTANNAPVAESEINKLFN